MRSRHPANITGHSCARRQVGSYLSVVLLCPLRAPCQMRTDVCDSSSRCLMGYRPLGRTWACLALSMCCAPTPVLRQAMAFRADPIVARPPEREIGPEIERLAALQHRGASRAGSADRFFCGRGGDAQLAATTWSDLSAKLGRVAPADDVARSQELPVVFVLTEALRIHALQGGGRTRAVFRHLGGCAKFSGDLHCDPDPLLLLDFCAAGARCHSERIMLRRLLRGARSHLRWLLGTPVLCRSARSREASSSLIFLHGVNSSGMWASSNTEKDSPCPICFEGGNPRRRLRCGHSYCFECIGKWLSTSSDCPTCRQPAEPLRKAMRTLLTFAQRSWPNAVFCIGLAAGANSICSHLVVATRDLAPLDALVYVVDMVAWSSFVAVAVSTSIDSFLHPSP